MPTENLISLLCKELRTVPGHLSASAVAMCKVVWHQFQVTWQAQADLRAEYVRLTGEVEALSSRLHKLETRGQSE